MAKDAVETKIGIGQKWQNFGFFAFFALFALFVSPLPPNEGN
jgi:hypothetical protein